MRTGSEIRDIAIQELTAWVFAPPSASISASANVPSSLAGSRARQARAALSVVLQSPAARPRETSLQETLAQIETRSRTVTLEPLAERFGMRGRIARKKPALNRTELIGLEPAAREELNVVHANRSLANRDAVRIGINHNTRLTKLIYHFAQGMPRVLLRLFWENQISQH